ncbi:hypothetical protein V5E97_00145 [Singulisphaera sp. Ch08]|uniref:Uncharacterized protein n=1 Tax=Singulisphaera sp. Ch08 TaxID=3120278 RepID=A0AAU7CH97_9BACT
MREIKFYVSTEAGVGVDVPDPTAGRRKSGIPIINDPTPCGGTGDREAKLAQNRVVRVEADSARSHSRRRIVANRKAGRCRGRKRAEAEVGDQTVTSRKINIPGQVQVGRTQVPDRESFYKGLTRPGCAEVDAARLISKFSRSVQHLDLRSRIAFDRDSIGEDEIIGLVR